MDFLVAVLALKSQQHFFNLKKVKINTAKQLVEWSL